MALVQANDGGRSLCYHAVPAVPCIETYNGVADKSNPVVATGFESNTGQTARHFNFALASGANCGTRLSR